MTVSGSIGSLFSGVLIRQAALLLASLMALSGCLVSEEPLFDAKNAKARPFKAGAYLACPYVEGAPDDECKIAVFAYRPAGGALLTLEGEEPSTLFFRRIARRIWLAQMSEVDEAHVYFLARPITDGFALSFILCKNLPADFRDEQQKAGGLEVSGDGDICEVKTPEAAIAAARETVDRKILPRTEIRLTRQVL